MMGLVLLVGRVVVLSLSRLVVVDSIGCLWRWVVRCLCCGLGCSVVRVCSRCRLGVCWYCLCSRVIVCLGWFRIWVVVV